MRQKARVGRKRAPIKSSDRSRRRAGIPDAAETSVAPEPASSSLTRMLGTLRLFSRQEPVLSVEELARRLHVPTSTAYRYVRQLTNEGLLVRWKGGFALGPRIIELDLQIRECDPIIVAAASKMSELASETGLDILLTRLYNRTILTVHIQSSGLLHKLNFGRGRPLPLFRGSSSKAIVAFLPAARLRRIFGDARADGDPDAKAADWNSFYETVTHIRRAGYCVSKGELNPGVEGISAPIFGSDRKVIASLTMIGDAERMLLLREERLAGLLTRVTAEISDALA